MAGYDISGNRLDAINTILCFVVPGSMVAMLFVASNVGWLATFAIGFVFSFLMLTNYALMHESAHNYLHSNKHLNLILGAVTSWHFPMSGRFLALTHQFHHRCNRTDHEMFDYYYSDDNKLVKFAQWYAVLFGLHYLIVPLGSLLAAIAPGFFNLPIFHKARSANKLFANIHGRLVWTIRIEVLTGLIYWMILWKSLNLHLPSVCLLYACAGFHWSTRQYLTHAFTPRNVRNGAIILRAGKLMRLVLLNGNFDLVHHQKPHLPWTQLPQHANKAEPHVSFWKQYLAMWKGPRPNHEPAPVPE